MQVKKIQITALGLLLLVALPLILSVSIFIKQKIVQHQRRQRFKTEHIETITLSPEKIYWVKPGKEILVNGKLFDVKSYKISNAGIQFTGFYDHKEDKLVKHFTKLIQEDDNSRRPAQAIVKLLCFPVFKEVNGFSLQNNWTIIDRQFPHYSEALCSAYPVTPLPPPKSA